MFIALISLFISIYWLLSILLRLYPQILHADDIRKRKAKAIFGSKAGIRNISHRGGAGENLENTMNAFDHSYQYGADMFEIDCQITKDGYAVVIHDNHILRLCGEDIYVNQTDYRDLPPLLSTQRLDFDHSFSITRSIPEHERKILLLEELFERYPEMPMNIDIKMNSVELIKAVERLVRKFGRTHLTIWGNSNHKQSTDIRAGNNEIGTLFSLKEVATTCILYYIGLLPFLSLSADYLEAPLFSVILEHSDSFPIQTKTFVRRLLLRVCDWLICNRGFIAYLKARGVPTYIFVLNAEHEWKRAADCGASGIMTDFPLKLKHWLSNKYAKI